VREIHRDYSIDIVARALEVLTLFDFQEPQLGLDDIARRLRISKTRAFRIAQTMVAANFLVWHAESRTYTLGQACIHLGLIARTGNQFKMDLMEALHKLHRECEETVNLALLRDRQLYYAVILESLYAFRISEHPGDLVSFTRTALGKAFLAATEDPTAYITAEQAITLENALAFVQNTGYALDDEESVLGVRCVGVPLVDSTGHIFGAVSVSGPSSRMTVARVQQLGERIKQLVREMAQEKEGASSNGA
jgi:DNA-binding IclR family transcriptional regulator